MNEPVPVEYDAEQGWYRAEADLTETRPILGLIAVFDKAREVESVELPPLYDVVESRALDDTLASQYHKPASQALTLVYTLEDCEVVIRCSDGFAITELHLRPAS